MKTVEEVLNSVLRRIVSKPDEVNIERNENILEIFANQEDYGVIIGKNGKNIRSLKNLINLKTYRDGLPRFELRLHSDGSQ